MWTGFHSFSYTDKVAFVEELDIECCHSAALSASVLNKTDQFLPLIAMDMVAIEVFCFHSSCRLVGSAELSHTYITIRMLCEC